MSGAEASARDGLPRVLLFTVALVCGLFLALAVHIALTGAGNGLAGPWRDLFPTHAAELKAAFAWWAIALSGCFGSLFAILLLRAAPLRGPRIFRLSLGIVFFCLLAAAGHGVSAAPSGSTIAIAATNLAAMSLGGFMAFCTTHFALSVEKAKK